MISICAKSRSSLAADGNWQTIASLATAVCGGKAWRRPDGRKLSGDGLRRALHRAAALLASKNMIEEKTEMGSTALQVRFIRRR